MYHCSFETQQNPAQNIKICTTEEAKIVQISVGHRSSYVLLYFQTVLYLEFGPWDNSRGKKTGSFCSNGATARNLRSWWSNTTDPGSFQQSTGTLQITLCYWAVNSDYWLFKWTLLCWEMSLILKRNKIFSIPLQEHKAVASTTTGSGWLMWWK